MEEIPSGCIAGWAAAQLTNTCLNSCSCSSFKFCGLPVPTWSGQDTSHSISPGNPKCHRDLPVQERPAVAQAVARENRQGLSQKFRKDRRWRSAGGARCYRNSLPTSESSPLAFACLQVLPIVPLAVQTRSSRYEHEIETGRESRKSIVDDHKFSGGHGDCLVVLEAEAKHAICCFLRLSSFSCRKRSEI